MYYTTLKKLRNAKPYPACKGRYAYLVEHGKFTDQSLISLEEILNINGLDDATWALRAVKDKNIDRDARLFACDCAMQVLKYYEDKHPDDRRPRNAINCARRYAKIQTDDNMEKMDAARVAAWNASRVAAWVVAGVADRDADRDAASNAAWAAAWAAARDAARDAAWAAAWYTSKKKQKQLFRKYFCSRSSF